MKYQLLYVALYVALYYATKHGTSIFVQAIPITLQGGYSDVITYFIYQIPGY